jgi:hypothetical protein
VNPIHPDDGQIQGFVDAELAPDLVAEVRTHVAGCAECRVRVAAAEAENAWTAERLRVLDHAAPRIGADAIVSDVDHRGRSWGRWAASILAIVGVAGAAYAAPGSPLPDLIRRFAASMSGGQRDATVPAGNAMKRVTAGAALAPGDLLRIVFLTEQPGGVATVSLTDSTTVQVRAVDGVAAFTLDPDRISIDNAGSSALFEVDIPLSAPRVEIMVGHRRVLLKDSGRIVTDTERDHDGKYRVSLSPPRG